MSKLTLDEQKQRQQDYWKTRMEQLEQSLHKDAEETVRDLESMYRAAERQIESDLSRWYGRFANNNGVVSMADARKLLTSAELKEFKWTLAEYREKAKDNADGKWQKELENVSARWHVSRLEALKYQLQQTVEVLAGGQLDALDSLLKNTYLNGYGQTAFTLQSGIGIGFDIAGLNGRAVQTLLNKPWALDGKNFSERIWGNKQVLIGELHKQLTQNLMTGGDLNRLIDSMSQKFNTSRSNAARLVYTEHAYAVSVATGESYRATGVQKVVFIATLDERTSEICQSMDGTIIDMKDYAPGQTVPPLHPYCRSTTAPYYADMAGIGERAARDPETGKTYYVPKEMKYPEWKEAFLKDPDTGETGSKEGLTPVGAGVVRFYDSTLAKAFGKENYDACMDILEGCGNPDAQALWNAYQEDIGINTVKYRGHECCDWTASLKINLKNDMQGSFYEKPGQVVFHESGHAIDMIASRRFGFDTGTGKFYSPSDIFSLRYKDGLFPKTIKAEVEAMITAKGETIKEEFKAHSTDYQWLIQHGYLDKWKYDFYLKNGQWLGGEPSYTKELVYQAIKNEIRPLNYYQKANLNDMLEGATGGKIGQGHGKAYFKKNAWALPTEAFAEMYDATVSSPESLEVIKQYLPKSYGVFCDMMKELVEGVK